MKLQWETFETEPNIKTVNYAGFNLVIKPVASCKFAGYINNKLVKVGFDSETSIETALINHVNKVNDECIH